ncbi:hypothetical protein AB0O95_12815 [Rhodoglobus sp. NPDC076762]
MRLPNLVRASVGVLLLAVLSGCAPSDATAPPEPTSTFVAPYATDEEALAAAEAAYAEYVQLSAEILRDGGKDPERILRIVTGEFTETNLADFAAFRDGERRSTGQATFDGVELQRYSSGGGYIELVSIYVCHDVSGVDVLDANGASVVLADRLERIFMVVTFDYDPAESQLKLSSREPWEQRQC